MDYTGLTYGKLTAIRKVRSGGGGIGQIWLFKCYCGNEIEHPVRIVRQGSRTQCANCTKKLGRIKDTTGIPEGLKKSYLEYLRSIRETNPRIDPVTPAAYVKLCNQDCYVCGSRPARGARWVPGMHCTAALCRICRSISDHVTPAKYLALIGRILSRLQPGSRHK